MNKSKEYRLDQIRKKEEELIKMIAEGEMVSSESGSTDSTETLQGDSDPTQSTVENLLEPSGSESGVTTEQGTENKSEQDVDFWKKKAFDAEYRFGKYKASTDSTIYSLRLETKDLRESILKLNKQLSENKPATSANSIDDVFSKDVINVLGEEAVDAIKKVISQTNERVDIAERRLQEQEVKTVTNKIKEDEVSAYDRFVSALTELVPDCVSLNCDKSFLAWLDQLDRTGTPRLTRLQAAQKIGDVERVASFFDDFKKTREVPAKVVRKDSIVNRTGPVQKSSSSEVHKQPQVESVSLSFMKRFEADVSKGKYKGRESEKIAIDKRIEAAYLSGNIVND